MWGRGSADQLGGRRQPDRRHQDPAGAAGRGGAAGVIVRSYGTVAEEDNDGGGLMYVMRAGAARAPAPERIPDVVILTEGTGCANGARSGIYRGQRGRMQIEVEVTGKSCHGSMPWEGRNPLEYGAAILVEAAERRAQTGEGFGRRRVPRAAARAPRAGPQLDTPSDCAVPERFTFRFDRRLTAGEDPQEALRARRGAGAAWPGPARRGSGSRCGAPYYTEPTWKGTRPGNPQIYPGWVTPEEHPAIAGGGRDAYRSVASPSYPRGGARGGQLRQEPRVARWIFSTDGVGYPVRCAGYVHRCAPRGKRWVHTGRVHAIPPCSASARASSRTPTRSASASTRGSSIR